MLLINTRETAGPEERYVGIPERLRDLTMAGILPANLLVALVSSEYLRDADWSVLSRIVWMLNTPTPVIPLDLGKDNAGLQAMSKSTIRTGNKTITCTVNPRAELAERAEEIGNRLILEILNVRGTIRKAADRKLTEPFAGVAIPLFNSEMRRILDYLMKESTLLAIKTGQDPNADTLSELSRIVLHLAADADATVMDGLTKQSELAKLVAKRAESRGNSGIETADVQQFIDGINADISRLEAEVAPISAEIDFWSRIDLATATVETLAGIPVNAVSTALTDYINARDEHAGLGDESTLVKLRKTSLAKQLPEILEDARTKKGEYLRVLDDRRTELNIKIRRAQASIDETFAPGKADIEVVQRAEQTAHAEMLESTKSRWVVDAADMAAVGTNLARLANGVVILPGGLTALPEDLTTDILNQAVLVIGGPARPELGDRWIPMPANPLDILSYGNREDLKPENVEDFITGAIRNYVTYTCVLLPELARANGMSTAQMHDDLQSRAYAYLAEHESIKDQVELEARIAKAQDASVAKAMADQARSIVLLVETIDPEIGSREVTDTDEFAKSYQLLKEAIRILDTNKSVADIDLNEFKNAIDTIVLSVSIMYLPKTDLDDLTRQVESLNRIVEQKKDWQSPAEATKKINDATAIAKRALDKLKLKHSQEIATHDEKKAAELKDMGDRLDSAQAELEKITGDVERQGQELSTAKVRASDQEATLKQLRESQTAQTANIEALNHVLTELLNIAITIGAGVEPLVTDINRMQGELKEVRQKLADTTTVSERVNNLSRALLAKLAHLDFSTGMYDVIKGKQDEGKLAAIEATLAHVKAILQNVVEDSTDDANSPTVNPVDTRDPSADRVELLQKLLGQLQIAISAAEIVRVNRKILEDGQAGTGEVFFDLAQGTGEVVDTVRPVIPVDRSPKVIAAGDIEPNEDEDEALVTYVTNPSHASIIPTDDSVCRQPIVAVEPVPGGGLQVTVGGETSSDTAAFAILAKTNPPVANDGTGEQLDGPNELPGPIDNLTEIQLPTAVKRDPAGSVPPAPQLPIAGSIGASRVGSTPTIDDYDKHEDADADGSVANMVQVGGGRGVADSGIFEVKRTPAAPPAIAMPPILLVSAPPPPVVPPASTVNAGAGRSEGKMGEPTWMQRIFGGKKS